jgi:hypothetical protein
MAAWSAWQRGRRGNTAGMTCGRQGTVVDKEAGSEWHQICGVIGARDTTDIKLGLGDPWNLEILGLMFIVC